MSKPLKIFLLIFAVLVIGFALFVYFSFAGLPWKKITVGNATLAYLQQKYDEEFEIEDRFYNFKDGSYGIKVHPVKEPTMSFYAEEGWGNDKFIDYYPEAVWVKQADQDFKEIVREIFPEKRRYRVDTVSGEGMEKVKKLPIPHYIDANAYIDVLVNLPKRFDESDAELERIMKLIQFAQQNGGNIHLFLTYEPNEEDTKNVTYITLTNEQIKQINSIEDIKKYYNK